MLARKTAKGVSTPVQHKENIDSATLSKRMQQSRERRKAGKRNQLSVKFDGDMAGAERKMDELLKTAAEESGSLRADFTTRLVEVFKKRGEIEARIITHSRALEQAYFAANSELREVLRGKLEDIDAGPKLPRDTQPEDRQPS